MSTPDPKAEQKLKQSIGFIGAGNMAEAMIKGLFVAPEPHHDEGLPYQPARDSGTLSDRQAETRHH